MNKVVKNLFLYFYSLGAEVSIWTWVRIVWGCVACRLALFVFSRTKNLSASPFKSPSGIHKYRFKKGIFTYSRDQNCVSDHPLGSFNPLVHILTRQGERLTHALNI